MELELFLAKLAENPQSIEFEETISTIEATYDFTPTAFSNGDAKNGAGENNGSCKIFAFAQLNQLDEPSTLACFGRYYRQDVLENPDGSDHANIRNFMKSGWSQVEFANPALRVK